MKKVAPFGILGMLMSMLALAALYALTWRSGAAIPAGAQFGLLVGVFSLGSFVIHNYVNLNIGLRLTIGQGIAYLIQWLVAGIVIGMIYQPR